MNVILGILCIVLGILIITFYEYFLDSKNKGVLSFKIRTAGIGSIIIGIGLIIKELFN